MQGTDKERNLGLATPLVREDNSFKRIARRFCRGIRHGKRHHTRKPPLTKKMELHNKFKLSKQEMKDNTERYNLLLCTYQGCDDPCWEIMFGCTGAIMLIVPTPVCAVWAGKSLSHSYYYEWT